MHKTMALILFLLFGAVWPLLSEAVERHMMQPLVPADKLVETRTLTSPLSSSPEIVEQGKALYNGKGACFNCHGKDGSGNGPLAAQRIHRLAISSTKAALNLTQINNDSSRAWRVVAFCDSAIFS